MLVTSYHILFSEHVSDHLYQFDTLGGWLFKKQLLCFSSYMVILCVGDLT